MGVAETQRESTPARTNSIQNHKAGRPLTGIREKYAACNCTACGESWHTTIALPGEGGTYPYFDTEEGLRRNGETMHCPNCGTAALVAHEKRLDRWPIVKKAYPWEIRKAGGCVMFICWAVIHETGYDWESTIVEQRNAYVIDPGGHWHRFTAMDRSGYSSMSTMYYTGCWYEMRRFQVADGNFSAILPHAADVYEGTRLENAKLELLEEQAQGIDLLHYARIYMRHPEIENIARNSPALCAALVNLTASQNGGLSVTGLDWVNWKAKKAARSLVHEQTGIQGRQQSPRPQSVGHWGAATRRCRLPAQRGTQGVRRHAGRRRSGLLRTSTRTFGLCSASVWCAYGTTYGSNKSARKIHSIGGTVGFLCGLLERRGTRGL